MLTGELTNLRAVERDDAVLIHGWFDDPEAMSWWGNPTPVISLHLLQQQLHIWLEDERTIGHPVGFIVATLDGEAVGFVLLSDLQPIDRNAELSIVLDLAYRGQGLGGDALETLIAVAFDQWGLHRLTARCEAVNERAHAFFQQHGFRLEGRLRDARFVDGGWQDVLIFGRVREAGELDD